MKSRDKPRPDWTVVLRRRPVRIVEGQPDGGYTDEYEIVCCDCGDDPGLDYRQVSPELQRIRGPYPMPAGVAAYVTRARRHPSPYGFRQPSRAGLAAEQTGGPPAPYAPMKG